MNLEQAKARRLAALKTRNADRMLVSPVNDVSELSMPDDGTLAAQIIEALDGGHTVEQFMAKFDWSKACVMENLYRIAKKTGLGIQRSDKTLYLVRPEGEDMHFLDSKVLTDTRVVRAA